MLRSPTDAPKGVAVPRAPCLALGAAATAEGEVALVLAAAGAQQEHPPLGGEGSSGGQQARLPRTGFAFDHQQPARTVMGCGEESEIVESSSSLSNNAIVAGIVLADDGTSPDPINRPGRDSPRSA